MKSSSPKKPMTKMMSKTSIKTPKGKVSVTTIKKPMKKY